MNPKRIFMNEEDASPGGGAAPANAPTESQASPGTAQQFDPAAFMSQVTAAVNKTVVETFGKLSNEHFANLRKAGALGKEKTPDTSTTQPDATAQRPTAPQTPSMADVEALMERRDTVTRIATEHKLTAQQTARMRKSLELEKPDDAGQWALSFVSEMGLARGSEQTVTQTSNQTTPNTQIQTNGNPISDKGSPAPGGVTNWEREFAENPIGMSAAARSMMDAKYGVEKARRMRVEAATRQGQNIRIQVTPQNQR